MRSDTLMVQGTTSDAGKTMLVAGLCRVLARRGVRVAPFKPQNMALNSAVAVDGGEIGRAQALQAMAARVPPRTDFNPVLLKPSSDIGAQIIIHGRARGNMDARTYHDYKPRAMAAVMESFARLTEEFQAVIVRRLAQNLVGALQLTILALQLLEPIPLRAGQSRASALVTLCLAHPFAQRLPRAANLRRNRADRRPLRVVLPLMFKH